MQTPKTKPVHLVVNHIGTTVMVLCLVKPLDLERGGFHADPDAVTCKRCRKMMEEAST